MAFSVNGNHLTCLENIFYTHVFNRKDLERNIYTYIVVYQQKSREALKMQNVAIFTPTVAQYMYQSQAEPLSFPVIS